MLRVAVFALAAALSPALTHAQEPDAAQVKQERAQAEREAPQIMDVLGVKPGMTIADIGSGGGAMTVVIGRLIGDGKVFATDITEHALRQTREYVVKEGLKNVTVLEGARASTNLPAGCCDAIFMRDVYHHILADSLDAFNKSVIASLKPGGRLAIIDFTPAKGSKLFPGVPENRGGHGVPIAVVEEELKAAGLIHVRTMPRFPEDDKYPLFLVLFRKP
jgi:cyclopropane fatty-acyl-phospholipid synthase-like methyltransferase